MGSPSDNRLLTQADLQFLATRLFSSIREFQWKRPAGHIPVERRMLGWTRTYFRTDSQSDVVDLPSSVSHRLPPGKIESLALPYEEYRAVFTDALLSDAYGTTLQVQPDADGGYVRLSGSPGYWWSPGGRQSYVKSDFYLPDKAQDPFGNVSTFGYDRYKLVVASASDAAGNTTSALVDYRVMQPHTVVDANQCASTVLFDTLGLVTATALAGAANEGDNLNGVTSAVSAASLRSLVSNVAFNPQSLVGNATSRILYDMWSFYERRGPCAVVTLTREVHSSAVGGAAARIQYSVAYSDGFGREIQTKTLVEPGRVNGVDTSRRWLASGTSVLNNKGAAVRSFQPFFSNTPAFEPGVIAGVSSTAFYDPLDRQVAMLHPNDSYEKVVFTPWRQERWDTNDTVAADPRTDSHVRAVAAPFLDALPAAWTTWLATRAPGLDPANLIAPATPAQEAALKAFAHRSTPIVSHLDALGHVFSVENSDGAGGTINTRTRLDVRGTITEMSDGAGNVTYRYTVDLLGRQIRVASSDAGTRLLFTDCLGKPVRSVDPDGNRVEMFYDRLRRVVEEWITPPAAGSAVLSSRTIYGEALSASLGKYHRGRVYRVYDAAGVTTNVAYDFKGNVLKSQRRYPKTIQGGTTWNALAGQTDVGAIETAAEALLESDKYESTTEHDALSRPVLVVAPDGARHAYSYNAGGLVESIDVTLPLENHTRRFLKSVEYDANRQEITSIFGNGVISRYDYEPLTSRLSRHRVSRASGEALRDRNYEYDPAGNVVYMYDSAQPVVFNSNQQIEPAYRYTYDALYQLISAEGREHVGTSACDYRNVTGKHGPVQTPRQPISNGQALRNYREDYAYDLRGNVIRVTHSARNGSWTRSQTYDTSAAVPTNRLAGSDAGCTGESTFSYSHDKRGNVLSAPHLSSLSWDALGNLVSVDINRVTNSVRDLAHYTYDGSGTRVRKVVTRGAERQERLYLGAHEIYRERAGASVAARRVTHHVMRGERRIALIESTASGGWRVRYQLADHIGSALLELDDSASALRISEEEYYPFGGTAWIAADNRVDADTRRYRYSGKERDDETGLYYFGARYYAPWLGRWMSCDPKEDGNRFVFARNNPVVLLDPDGREPQCAGKLNCTFDEDPNGYDWIRLDNIMTQKYGFDWPTKDEARAQAGLVRELIAEDNYRRNASSWQKLKDWSSEKSASLANSLRETRPVKAVVAVDDSLKETAELVGADLTTQAFGPIQDAQKLRLGSDATFSGNTQDIGAHVGGGLYKVSRDQLMGIGVGKALPMVGGILTGVTPKTASVVSTGLTIQQKFPGATFTTIAGKRVKSWGMSTLVGVSRTQFRSAAQRIIRGTPGHPLEKLLNQSGKFMNATAAGLDQVSWLENPTFVEAGHVISMKSGKEEMLILMSAHKNRMLSATIESKAGDIWMALPREALDIGGIAVDPELADDLVKFGALDAQVVKTAKRITF
jgi:RHS repeat-associated protein